MDDNGNVEVLKNAYAFWNDNKEQAFEHWMNLFFEDVSLISLADGAKGMGFSRTCFCKNDVLSYFQELAEEWELIHYSMFAANALHQNAGQL